MKKIISALSLFAALLSISSAIAQSVVVDASSPSETFDPFWSKCVGAGRANEALRAGWLEHMELAQKECGFQYVRFHGLFHDDMFPMVMEKGKWVYNWQYIDDVFDRLLDLNVKPFIELGFFPKALAAENSKTVFWWNGNVTPDESKFGQWHDFIKAFTQHCVDRYGRNEVLTWYFEVWNEPNLINLFFDGTRDQYFELYKQSVLAVRSVDDRFKVGGPSTSNFVADNRYAGAVEDNSAFNELISTADVNTLEWKGVWIEELLEYCAKEKLPLDFISCHPYPTDFPLDPSIGRNKSLSRHVTSLQEDLTWLKKSIAKSKFPDAEIHLTEWNTSPNSRDAMHDRLPAAAYIVKANLDCIGLTNSLAFWTFTDVFEEKGGGASIFHGGFGMINYQGLVKPSFHAYRMLNCLGGEKLYSNEHLFVSRHADSGKVVALAYNYPQEYNKAVPSGTDKRNSGTARELDFTLEGLAPGTTFKMEILDTESGDIHTYWEKMGKPEPPTREQIKVMKEFASRLRTEIFVADADGKVSIDYTLTPWCVVLIEQIN
ncbi:MAG: glycoside hydrolase [Rikenellaceae bacterium]